jgi:hypothetical protein
MESFVVCIAAELLTNPDLDICYELPDVLSRESHGAIQSEGYEFTDDKKAILLHFASPRLDQALPTVIEVLEQVEVLENDLKKAAIVAVENGPNYDVVYPLGYKGQFTL